MQWRDRLLRRWLEEAVRDVAYTVRQHRRTPLSSALIVVTLGIGIGANATMVGAIDRLLFRPPEHVREPERVVRLLLATRNAMGGETVSPRTNYPTFLDFERDVSAFETVGAYTLTQMSFGQGPDAVEVRAALVSGSFFSVFGVRPTLGRLFTRADDVESRGAPIAVLSHGFWLRQFAGDSAIVDRRVRIGSFTYSLIGVAPAGFLGVHGVSTDIWLPLTVAAEKDLGLPLSLEDRGSAWLSVVARLHAPSTRALAERQATNVWRERNSFAGDRATNRRVVAASVILGRGPDRPREVNVAIWLAGVSALVLLIACANVANLLLARAFVRRREIAVRLAMGASRERLVRQMLAEAMLLAMVGGVAALVIAAIGGQIVTRLLLPEAAADGLLNLRVLLTTASIALGTGALITLGPALRSTSLDLTRSLKVGEGGTDRRSARLRSWLLGVQSALCMVLLVIAALFAQSLRRIQDLDFGVDLDRTLIARVNLGAAAVPRAALQDTYETMLQRVRAIDGVSHVALAAQDPFTSGRAIPAHTPERSEESLWHREDIAAVPKEVLVDSGFFRALGTTSLRGRDFASMDRRGSPRVAIVNETLARLLWPGEEPLGRCLLLAFGGGECFTVVGVVRGFLRRTILDRDELVVYRPIAQSDGYVRPGSIIVGVSGDAAAVATRVREAIQGVRSDLPAVAVARVGDMLAPQFRPWKMAATLFGFFGAIALAIAIVGLYGVVSFTAAQRTREIAIRMVLGAGPSRVLAVVAGSALLVVVAGLMVGAFAALGVRRWIGPLLFQTSPSDPAIVAGAAVLLLAVAAAASVIPTVGVLRQSPGSSLRAE